MSTKRGWREKVMDAPPKKDALQEILRQLAEREPEAKDFAARMASGYSKTQRSLDDVLAEPGGLRRFLDALTDNSKVIEDALVKVSGKTLKELADHPRGVEGYLRKLAKDTGAIGRLVLALIPGPEGYQHLFLALSGVRTETVRQVKFECSEAFYKQLMDEKLKRNLTIQQMAVRALERYWAIPESFHRSIEEQALEKSTPLSEVLWEMTVFLSTIVQSGKLREGPTWASEEAMLLRNDLEAVQQYLEQLPSNKVDLVREQLELDLKYYRTSRLMRTGRRKRTDVNDRVELERED
jgi:hypothetical protein